MSAQLLEVQPLTRAAFAPFGQVIETKGVQPYPINRGTTARFHDLAQLDLAEGGGTPLISVFRGQPFTPPIAIRLVERHPLGSQAFVPLSGRSYLVVVAPMQGDGTPGVPLAFLARGDQGVNYAKGTWHHPLLALQQESDFLVIDRGGPGVNLEEHRYPGGGYLVEAI
ncbi:MAG: ureidoglycolate lyase [Kiloniellales bacterium]